MKKIPVKTLYLLSVIAVGLMVLGVGSTYAVFTTTAEISDPITLESYLTHSSDIIETVEVEVPAGEKISTTLNITNNSGTTLNCIVWYLDEGKRIIVGANGNTTGSLTNGSKYSVDIELYNGSDSSEIVILGISSNSNSVVLDGNMKNIPSGVISASDEFSYVDNYTGVGCSDVTCMLDYLYDLVS